MNISDFLLRFKTFRAAQYHNKSGFRNQEVPDQRIEIMARADELPERSPGRTKGIKLRDAQTTFRVRSLALKRTCQECGGEMTTSPPMNSLQCIWLRNAADSNRSR